MAVLINFKICDNSKDCEGIKSCPTGAFSWNEKEKTIYIKEELCINCGKCETCNVNAITVTHTQEEYERIKREIEEDPRIMKDLFIDRYGASPVLDIYNATEDNLDFILNSKVSFVIELYKEEYAMCLLKSIPIKELLQEYDKNVAYRKLNIVTDKIIKEYDIKELPALLFIKENKVLGKIEGYYDEDSYDEIVNKIKKIRGKNIK